MWPVALQLVFSAIKNPLALVSHLSGFFISQEPVSSLTFAIADLGSFYNLISSPLSLTECLRLKQTRWTTSKKDQECFKEEFVEYFSQFVSIPGVGPSAVSVWRAQGGRICVLLLQEGNK